MNVNPGRFEAILASFTDAVIILNEGLEIEWMNPAAESLFGVSFTQVGGRSVRDALPGAEGVLPELARSMENGVTVIDHDVSIGTGRGGAVSCVLSVHPLDDEEGRGAVLALRDLTGLRALERTARLREQAEETAALAAGIAHEIKNPLGGVRGAAQLLGAETDDKTVKKYAELVIREADRINRLIMELIDLNQPKPIVKNPVNIYTILDEALELMRPEMERKKITVERLFDPSLPDVPGDRDRLAQIFLNVLKNAVEACGEGGEVTLSTRHSGAAPRPAALKREAKFTLIEIMDDGPGLDPEMAPHLFTPFYTGKKGGSGLGLSVSLSLTLAHGGLLEMGERSDGRPGAAAFIYLPHA